MSWITLTPNDVATRLTAPELSALRTLVTVPGQPDPLIEILADVAEEIRGHVAACYRNTLGPVGTIPPNLQATALAIIRWRLITRIPGDRLASEPRKLEYENAVRLLQAVAAGKFVVTAPDLPAPPTDVTPPPSPRIRPKPRRPL